LQRMKFVTTENQQNYQQRREKQRTFVEILN